MVATALATLTGAIPSLIVVIALAKRKSKYDTNKNDESLSSDVTVDSIQAVAGIYTEQVIVYDTAALIMHALAEKYDGLEDLFGFPHVLASCIFIAIGGLSAAMGFRLVRCRLTQSLGGKLTYMSNSRGLACQQSTIGAIVAVSLMKLPVSSVHAFVGSLVGVGLADNPQELDNGLILFDFETVEGRDFVLNNGTWHINHCPILLRPWEKNIQVVNLEQKKVPVWVKLSKVPLELLTEQGLSYVASGLGIPVCFEKKVEYISRGNSARMCIDITVQGELPKTLTLVMEDGQYTDVEVEYPWKTVATKKWVPKAQAQVSSAEDSKTPNGLAKETALVVEEVPGSGKLKGAELSRSPQKRPVLMKEGCSMPLSKNVAKRSAVF
ncbi:hypothetical protein CRG98_006387 [Punica granatum]|uniref:Uncharacterized protein n=1 Tax=Punica granatum TaxID=22663 RepID=A0A2I0KXQ8_PUNGR|nr:hypothetical protein CRG98_006387 [Punica granatum]